MKNSRFLFLIICSLLFVIFPAHSFAVTRQSVVFTDSYSGWNEIGKYQPTVLVENGISKMWFSTYDGTTVKIGYAESPNGLNWTNYGPVLSVKDNAHDPSVIKTESGYTMWFAVDETNVSGIKIYRALSTNGRDWEVNPPIPVLTPTAGFWDGISITSPQVLYDNGVYKMWYSGYSTQWNIGSAASADGVTWVKNANGMITSFSDGAWVNKVENGYELYYQHAENCGWGIFRVKSLDGILWKDLSQPESIICSIEGEDNSVIGPSVVQRSGVNYIYYTGIDTNGIGRIRLLTEPFAAQPSLTPTPTSIPTPTLTLTPTTPPIQRRTPIVLIPGFLASWNREAILHNTKVTPDSWVENPIVHEYDGVKNTFSRLGYKLNTDFFVFSYDWRQSVLETVKNLRDFMCEKVKSCDNNSKVILIGHSLGGLVSRIYAQKYTTEGIKQIITIGSPNTGTAKVYKPLLTGELDNENTTLWFVESMLLRLYSSRGQSDADVLRSQLPVLTDLLPTYNFIFDSKGNPVQQTPGFQNTILPAYAETISNLGSVLTTAGSIQYQTLFGYKLSRSGVLASEIRKTGDGTVVGSSALIGSHTLGLTGNHRELIYTKQNIKKLLTELSIPYKDSQIVAGSGTQVNPATVFLVRSPVTISVKFGGKTYVDHEGILLVPNLRKEPYTLTIQGTAPGNYEILIGELANKVSWKSVTGVVDTAIPSEYRKKVTIEPSKLKFCRNNHYIISWLFRLICSSY